MDLLFHYLPQVVPPTGDPNPRGQGEYNLASLHTQLILQLRPNLSLVHTDGSDDIPRELLELTSESATRLTRLLSEVDRQVAEARKQKQKKVGDKQHRGGGQKRHELAPPPGYESNDVATAPHSKAPRHHHHHHHHGKITTSRKPSKVTSESKEAEVKPTTQGGCESEEGEFSSDTDDVDDDEEEDEEEEEDDDVDVTDDDDDVTEDEDDEEEEEEDDDDADYEEAEPMQRQSPQLISAVSFLLFCFNRRFGHFLNVFFSQSQLSESTHPRFSLSVSRSHREEETFTPSQPQRSTATAPAYRPHPSISAGSLLARFTQSRVAPQIGPAPLPLYNNPTPPDYRPASFFTSQMTAFQSWLKHVSASASSCQQRHAAIQLPILLQVLLSQTHRIRALQLLSDFLDLGSWAVSHCITVGILPYIVRLFHSNVPEVKPHLVFIWGKIIASAQIDFSRHEGIRDSGYRYFVSCLQDVGSLSPLVRTMATFALAKMLVRSDTGAPDPLFQEVYYSAKPISFIQIAAEELTRASAAASASKEGHNYDHLKVWLLLALGRVWMGCEEAKWLAVRGEGGRVVESTIFPRLADPDPVVRAAAVFALGTLIDQSASVTESKLNPHEADRVSSSAPPSSPPAFTR